MASSPDSSLVGSGTSSRTNLPGAIWTQVAGTGSGRGMDFPRLRPRAFLDSTDGDSGGSGTIAIGSRVPDAPIPPSGAPGGVPSTQCGSGHARETLAGSGLAG